VSTITTEPAKPRFSLTAPPPKIVLLPDAQFFTRVVPVEGAATAAEVAAQVELALEALAPFPLAQMYHGHFWKPGAKHALVFAAYRKRFTSEQTDDWADAEIVMPAFAAILPAKVGRATTIVLSTESNLTAVYWSDADDVPSAVVSRPVPPEVTDADRAMLRDELLRAVGESVTVKELDEIPELDPESDEGKLAFRVGELETVFTREALDALDVRDKDDLTARRRARSRDLLLWRIFLGAAAAIVFALLLEVGVIGGKFWQKGRTAIVDARAPEVARIEKQNALATSIEELSTKRLLPYEMIYLVDAKRPDSVIFTRVSAASGSIYTIEVRAQTTVPNDMIVYRSALMALEECESVELTAETLNNNVQPFKLKVTFKQDRVKQEDPS
jgi:hypothetical protein